MSSVNGLGAFIGRKFKEIRISSGRSQEAISRGAGIARISTLSLELGRVDNPKIGTVYSLARELGADLGEILSEYEGEGTE